jgi:hypothetical protein
MKCNDAVRIEVSDCEIKSPKETRGRLVLIEYEEDLKSLKI